MSCKPVTTRVLRHKLGSLNAVIVIVQEEGQGGCSEAEVETEEDETLQVAELFLSEGITAERQEMADPWGAHLHLGAYREKEWVMSKNCSSSTCHTQRCTCLLARRSAVTPSSWKQSAATGVDARNLSMMFTVRQQHSKDRRKCLCTGMSQLTSVHRASAVNYKQNTESIRLIKCNNLWIPSYCNAMHSATTSTTIAEISVSL